MPLGLLLGMGGLLALYVGLQTVSQGVLGPELANNTKAPLVAVATEVFGDWGGKMLIAGAVISIYGSPQRRHAGGAQGYFRDHRWTVTCRDSLARCIRSTRRLTSRLYSSR